MTRRVCGHSADTAKASANAVLACPEGKLAKASPPMKCRKLNGLA
jgi:hypothetical protein